MCLIDASQNISTLLSSCPKQIVHHSTEIAHHSTEIVHYIVPSTDLLFIKIIIKSFYMIGKPLCMSFRTTVQQQMSEKLYCWLLYVWVGPCLLRLCYRWGSKAPWYDIPWRFLHNTMMYGCIFLACDLARSSSLLQWSYK